MKQDPGIIWRAKINRSERPDLGTPTLTETSEGESLVISLCLKVKTSLVTKMMSCSVVKVLNLIKMLHDLKQVIDTQRSSNFASLKQFGKEERVNSDVKD